MIFGNRDQKAIHIDTAGELASITDEKTAPVDADISLIEDSGAAGVKKRLSWTSIKATLKTYFDGLYSVLAHTHTQLHDRSHSITSISDHTSSATAGQMLKADANGLQVNATNSDAQVSSAVSASHTQGTDVALGAVGTKNPPIDADKVLYRNSASSDAIVTSTWTQVKAFLKTYLDTLYSAVGALFNVVEDTTPQLGGDLDVNNKNIHLNDTAITDNRANGIILKLTYGETIAFPNLLVMKSDGKLYKTDANAGTTMPAMYMALESGNANNVKKVLKLGLVRDDDWNWTLGDGEANFLYADTATAGGMTQTPPSGAADRAQVVAHVVTADSILFNPEMGTIEIV